MLLLSLVQLSRMPSTDCVVLVSEAPMAPKAVRKSQLPSRSARIVVFSNSVAFSSRICTCLVTVLFDNLVGDHQQLSQFHSMCNVIGVILVAGVRGACAALSLKWSVKTERVESVCEVHVGRVECCVNYVFRAKRKGANENYS